MNQLAVGQISDPIGKTGSTSPYADWHGDLGFEIIQVTSISNLIPSCSNGACEEIPYTPTVPHNRDDPEPFGEWLTKNKIPIYVTKRYRNPYNQAYTPMWIDQIKRNLLSKKKKQAFQTWLDTTKANYDIQYSGPYNPST